MLPSSPGLAVSQSLLPGVSRISTYLQWCQENPFSFCPQALLPTAPVSAEAAHRWRKTPGFPVRGGLLKHWIVGNKPQGWKEMAQYLKSTSYDLHIHVYAQAPIYIGAHLQTYLLNQKQNKTKKVTFKAQKWKNGWTVGPGEEHHSSCHPSAWQQPPSHLLPEADRGVRLPSRWVRSCWRFHSNSWVVGSQPPNAAAAIPRGRNHCLLIFY